MKFKKGTAYLVKSYFGRNCEPELVPVEIVTVGRKYITTKYGARYKIKEKGAFGEFDYSEILFPTEEEAKEYLERFQLGRKLSGMHRKWEDYSLSELRSMRDILTHFSAEKKDMPDIVDEILNRTENTYPGKAQDIYDTWAAAQTEHERKSIEGMFLIFTGMEFKDFMERGGI